MPPPLLQDIMVLLQATFQVRYMPYFSSSTLPICPSSSLPLDEQPGKEGARPISNCGIPLLEYTAAAQPHPSICAPRARCGCRPRSTKNVVADLLRHHISWRQ